MEESGENWPCDSDLEAGDDDVKDFIFEEGEFVCDDEGHDSFSDTEGQPYKKEELKERLLALSATIPGFNKIDDTSILDKASNYVKQLQERVRELEQEVDQSNNICSNKGKGKGSTSNCEVKYCDDYYYGSNDHTLPEVRARVLQKDVLVIIHCEKQKGIMLKILTHLENLHLSVVNSSVLRFGKSTLDITIVAQMGDGYNITVDELVKTLRVVISTQ